MDATQVQAVLEQLNYRWESFTVTDFIQHLSSLRHRPVELAGIQLHISSGLCICTPDRDYIFYDIQRHNTIQLHAILHEAAHLLMNHSAFVLTVDDIQHLSEVLLHINLRTRGVYSDPQMKQEEGEAEYFAFLSQRAIVEGQRRKQTSQTDVSDDIFIPPFTGHSNRNN